MRFEQLDYLFRRRMKRQGTHLLPPLRSTRPPARRQVMSRFPFCDTNKKVGTRPLHVSNDITVANQSARQIHPTHLPQSPRHQPFSLAASQD
jgi:hypothetical protein